MNEARTLAEYLRFSFENPPEDSENDDKYFGSAYKNGVLVSEKLTPHIFRDVKEVSEKLKLPLNYFDVLIYSDPCIQAMCLTLNAQKCLIMISSGLINLLDSSELKFVLGHELGHFLLKHNGKSHYGQSYVSLISKKQEISADRIGLYVCGEVNKALSALLKTASGLNDNHLVFDISKFISQYEFKTDENYGNQLESSHPSMIIRARALLWFSSSEVYFNLPEINSKSSLENIEKRIMSDLHSDFDGDIGMEVSHLKGEFILWSVAIEIFQTGKFTKHSQIVISQFLGPDKLHRLISYFNEMDENEIEIDLRERISIVTNSLHKHLQNSYDIQLEKLNKSLGDIKARLLDLDEVC